MFNAQIWGSWFELVLPRNPVFVDSRIEVFPASVWGDYLAVSSGRQGWQRILQRWRVRAVPVPPKKDLPEHVADQKVFLDTQLKPRLDRAVAGRGHVLFVDAAHFVYGTYLCCLWSVARVFVRAASDRQRFNVLGAWDAVARTLVTVTNAKHVTAVARVHMATSDTLTPSLT